MKRFLASWAGAFRDGWAVAKALPLLILAVGTLEFAQHAVELHLGFFSADGAARALAAQAPLRMAFGWPKMLALYAVGFFATRWLVTRDAHLAMRPSAQALRRYAWVVVFQLIPAATILYAAPLVDWLGGGADDVLPVRIVFGLGQQLLEPLLLLWFVNAAMGTNAYGPAAAARTAWRFYLWALLLVFVTRVPVAQLHGRLNLWPIGQTPALQWSMLALDALVVGVLAVVVPAIQLRIARHVAERRDVPLLGDEGETPSAVGSGLRDRHA